MVEHGRPIMKLKVYEYTNCGTCRKALQFLDSRGIDYRVVPIREQPPSKAELLTMLKVYGGDLRKLFNTSGQEYKRLNLKAKLPSMSVDEALELLSKNGHLVKRPIVLIEGGGGLVGFKEDEWKNLLKNI